jgi:hypothetical protein
MSQQDLSQYVDAVRDEQTPAPGASPAGELSGAATSDTDAFETPGAEAFPGDGVDVDGRATLSVEVCLPDGDEETVRFARVAGEGGVGRSELDAPEAAAATLTDAVGSPAVLTGGGRVVGDQRYGFGSLESVTAEGDSIRVEIDEKHAINGRPKDDPRTPILGSWQVYLPATGAEAETIANAIRAYQTGETDHFRASQRRRANKRERLYERFRSLSPGDTVSTPAYATDLTVISHSYDVWATGVSTLRGSTDKQVHAVVVSNPRGGFYQLGIQQSCSDDELPTCYLSRSLKHVPTPNTEFSVEDRFTADDCAVEGGSPADDAPFAIPDRAADESPLPAKCRRESLRDFNGIGENTAREVFKTAGTTCAHEIAYALYGEGDVDAAAGAVAEAIKTSPKHNEVFNRLKDIHNDTLK